MPSRIYFSTLSARGALRAMRLYVPLSIEFFLKLFPTFALNGAHVSLSFHGSMGGGEAHLKSRFPYDETTLLQRLGLQGSGDRRHAIEVS